MTHSDDPTHDMARHLSPEQAEQLLSVTARPNDVPEEVAGLASFVATMRAPDEVGDVADAAREQRAVASIAAAIRNAPADLSANREARVRRLVPKAAVAAVAVVLVGGTAAAAANGSLPDPAQRFISRALSHVHISVPDPDDRAGPNPLAPEDGQKPSSGTAGDNGTGGGGVTRPSSDKHPNTGGRVPKGGATTPGNPGVGVPKAGLCANEHADAAARRKLEDAAQAAGLSVADYCGDVKAPSDAGTATTTTTVPKPHGKPTATPTTPNRPTVTTPNSNGNANETANSNVTASGVDSSKAPAKPTKKAS